MLSHDNLIYNSKVSAKYLEMEPGNERILSYLPLSHAAAQVSLQHDYIHLAIRSSVNL